MSRKRIAILGASFDPPHFGHAGMAIAALDTQTADTIWLCPSPARWDKEQAAPQALRTHWTQAMAQAMNNLGFPTEVSLEELTFGSFRGSCFFLHHLARKHPDCEFRLLLGEDSWHTLPLWRDPVLSSVNGRQILKDFVVLVVPREPQNTPFKENDSVHLRLEDVRSPHVILPTLSSMHKRFFQLFDTDQVASLGSTHLRAALATGNVPHKFCFSEVEKMVAEQNPYKDIST